MPGLTARFEAPEIAPRIAGHDSAHMQRKWVMRPDTTDAAREDIGRGPPPPVLQCNDQIQEKIWRGEELIHPITCLQAADDCLEMLPDPASVTIFSTGCRDSEVTTELLRNLALMTVEGAKVATVPSQLLSGLPLENSRSGCRSQQTLADVSKSAPRFRRPIFIFDSLHCTEFDLVRLVTLMLADPGVGVLVVASDLKNFSGVARHKHDEWLSWPLRTEELQSKLRHLINCGSPQFPEELCKTQLDWEKQCADASKRDSKRRADRAMSSLESSTKTPAARRVAKKWRLKKSGWILVAPDERIIRLSLLERQLFELMLSASNRRMSYDSWSMAVGDDSIRTLREVVARLRRKAEEIGLRMPIRAERQTSYVFCEPLA